MVEIVVILAIITAISAVVLFSFSGLNEGAALNRSVREIALAMRRAQNMSLAVTSISTPTGPRVPKAVGIRISLNEPQRYFIFADFGPGASGAPDGRWRAGDDVKIGSDVIFPRGIKVTGLECRDSSPPPVYTDCPRIIHILFTAPEAVLAITGENGNDLGDIINIRFGRPSGADTKTVTVRTSGQISIR